MDSRSVFRQRALFVAVVSVGVLVAVYIDSTIPHGGPVQVQYSESQAAAPADILGFVGGPYLLSPGVCSPPLTIQVENTSRAPVAVSAATTFTLSTTTSTVSIYSDAACTKAIKSIAVAVGANSATFYAEGTLASGWGGVIASSSLTGGWKQDQYFETPPTTTPPALPTSTP
jgi:hypothetical protein